MFDDAVTTRWATTVDGVQIAYQVIGDGPVDLLYIPPGASHIEQRWDDPGYAHAYRRLAGFSRLLTLDKRGSGLSDRHVDFPGSNAQVLDILAVLDAIGSRSAYLFGVQESGAAALTCAAFHPGRVQGVIVWAGFVRSVFLDDPQRVEALVQQSIDNYGTAGSFLDIGACRSDTAFMEWWTKMLRSSVSPSGFGRWLRTTLELDVTDVLPTVTVPVLVMNSAGNRLVTGERSRELAGRLPAAQFVELPGDNYPWWYRLGVDAVIDEIERFVTGAVAQPDADRVLATVLFTDLVDSTAQAVAAGDARWAAVLEDHDVIAKRVVGEAGGRLVKTTGDGILATFDAPVRAVRAAARLMQETRRLGVKMRAGLHTAEIQVRGHDVAGIAVHVAARIMALAGPDEVLVSRTVKDLTAGSGLSFNPRGVFEFKGIDDHWEVLRLNSQERR